MKPERLNISAFQAVDTGFDWNGRYYVAFSNNASVFLRDTDELRRFLKLPKGLPSRSSFDSWIASLEAADQERVNKKAEPLTSEAPIEQTLPNLSQELLATGFGPEVFAGELDESDPQYQTRTVI